MKYFTSNPLEQMMMQKPRAIREDNPPTAPTGHFCHGCKRYGQDCIHPCYREIRRTEVAPCAS